MFKKTAIAIGIISGLILSYAGVASATLRVVQTPTYHLYAGESGTATSVRITPFPKDLDGNKLTISDFGDTPTFTVDPKISGIEEIESFTGITDNGDGTATLTGLTRDLLSKYPYTTAGTGRTHGSGATLVFGNNPQVYGRLWAPENNATSTATLAFSSTTPPHLDAEPASWSTLNPESFVTYAKLSATSIAGAVNSSETVNGISQLATAAQVASTTSSGSTGARLVIPASLGTSTPTVTGLWSVMSLNDGKLSPNWLNGASENYTFAGATSLNGFLDTASSTFTATTTISGSNATSNALVINTVKYGFPSSQGTANTSLINNGSGVLSWGIAQNAQYTFSTTSPSAVAVNTTLSSASLPIPANTLTGSSTITFTGDAQCVWGSSLGQCTLTIGDAAGDTFVTATMQGGTSLTCDYPYTATVSANNSTSSQVSMIVGMSNCGASNAGKIYQNTNTTSANLSLATSFLVKLNVANGTGNSGTINPLVITVHP